MKINSTADLPEWFDLEKYKGCAEFGALEWYACIRERVRVAHVVEALVSGERGSIRKKLASMRAHPLAAIDRKEELIQQLLPRPAVRSATWQALERAARLDRMTNSKQAPAWESLGDAIRLASPDNELGNERALQESETLMIPGWLDREADAALAIVDLSATDAVLVDAFKEWLIQARAGQPTVARKKTRKRYAIERWAGYGLLPYLDLKIWAIETGTKIPLDVLRDAIRPRHSDSEHIRKTVASLARSLVADLSGLRAMAAAEVEEPALMFLHIPETFES